jgi:hypothetical protein
MLCANYEVVDPFPEFPEFRDQLVCISNIPGSNLGPETGYSDWNVSYFHSTPFKQTLEKHLKVGPDRMLPYHFWTIHSTNTRSPKYRHEQVSVL